MKFIKKHGITILASIIFFIGLGLLMYPSFADYWNSFHQTRAIMTYAEHVANLENEDYDKILDSARKYNEELGESGISWNPSKEQLARYEKELNIDGSGIMGYIDIPKIDVKLPVYHGIDDSVLQVSIGHLTPTSLPVGGESSHCALSGHRGLPSARLFSDLDKLKKGDTWTITVLNETLTYEVDQIRIVEPADLSSLTIEGKKDYCTLVTCTPYGINTHRMLVRGHRVPNASGNARVVAEAIQIEPIYVAPFLTVPIIVILCIIMLMNTRRRRKYHPAILTEQYLEERHIRKPDDYM